MHVNHPKVKLCHVVFEKKARPHIKVLIKKQGNLKFLSLFRGMMKKLCLKIF